MQWISQILFALCLGTGIWFFTGRVRFIRRNILLGRDVDLSDNPAARWKQMLWVAMGQSKMATRPVAAVFHLFVYLGFVLINIEVMEILIDGILGTHRIFSFMGNIYNLAIGFFEILALLVIIACVVFLAAKRCNHHPAGGNCAHGSLAIHECSRSNPAIPRSSALYCWRRKFSGEPVFGSFMRCL